MRDTFSQVGPVCLAELELLDRTLQLLQSRAVDFRQGRLLVELARARYKLAAVCEKTRQDGKELPQ